MPEYARVDGNTVIERREIDALPEHKSHLWRPVVYEGTGPLSDVIVEPAQVRIVRSVPPVTQAEVVAERERRLALGFDYNFGDARGVHRVGTTPDDMKGWDEVSKFAGALIDAGHTSTTIAIATDTGLCTVTPIEWRAIEIASAAFRQPLWAASFALMAMTPIPASFADDSYWTP